MWKLSQHKEKENEEYINARAAEWGHLPIFITESFIPLFFFKAQWWIIILVVYALDWVWSLVRYKWISQRVSEFGWQFNKIKWLIIIVIAVLFLKNHFYTEGIITILWPFISLILEMIGPPLNAKKMKKIFKAKISF